MLDLLIFTGKDIYNFRALVEDFELVSKSKQLLFLFQETHRAF